MGKWRAYMRHWQAEVWQWRAEIFGCPVSAPLKLLDWMIPAKPPIVICQYYLFHVHLHIEIRWMFRAIDLSSLAAFKWVGGVGGR